MDKLSQFEKKYRNESSKRSVKRCRARERAREIAREERQRIKSADELAERQRAHLDAYQAILDKTATPEQRKLFLSVEEAELWRSRGIELSQRIDGRLYDGYEWPGGIVGGKYYQNAFKKPGLESHKNPVLLRFVTASGKAATGNFLAGPTKSTCFVRSRKLFGLDMPYVHCGQNCKDMWRLDCDLEFPSLQHFKDWLAGLRLPFLPHLAVWIFDDRRPGWVLRPHIYFLLPEGHAVWRDKQQHRMLNQVIASLNLLLKADEGGLANPYHGKNPLSPHCHYTIINDEHFPTLSEYLAGLPINLDRRMMARKMSVDRLTNDCFDFGQSNTYFSTVSKVCNAAAKRLFADGCQIDDRRIFAEIIRDTVTEGLQNQFPLIDFRGLESLKRMIGTCARWSAQKFDPTKTRTMERDQGAAAHLMKKGDDAGTRMQKGQLFSADVKSKATRTAMTTAIMTIMRDGSEPTPANIGAIVDKSRNTVKWHFFSAYVTAVASASIEASVKEVLSVSTPSKPSTSILLLAHQATDVPKSWRDDRLDDLVREAKLRSGRLRRLDSKRIASRPAAIPGSATIDFLSAGQVRRFSPRTSVGREC